MFKRVIFCSIFFSIHGFSQCGEGDVRDIFYCPDFLSFTIRAVGNRQVSEAEDVVSRLTNLQQQYSQGGFFDHQRREIPGGIIFTLGIFYDSNRQEGQDLVRVLDEDLQRVYAKSFKKDRLFLHLTEQARMYRANGNGYYLFLQKMGCGPLSEVSCFHQLITLNARKKFYQRLLQIKQKLLNSTHWASWRYHLAGYYPQKYIFDWSVIRRNFERGAILSFETFYYWRGLNTLVPNYAQRLENLKVQQLID